MKIKLTSCISMKKLILKPYLLFWFSIPIIVLIGFLDNKSLDVSIYDTYFVFSKYHICIVTSIVFGVLGFGYWLMEILKRKQLKWLVSVHSWLTLGGTLVLIIFPYFFNKNDLIELNLIAVLTSLIILIGQLFYILNFIIAMFKRKRVETH